MTPEATLVEAIRAPRPDIHLDEFAGLVGVVFDPSGTVDEVRSLLDSLAARCNPDFRSVLALFGTGGLVGNTANYSDPRNSYLHQVLRRRLGIPITLSVCAIEVGRRVGLDVQGVGLPGHFVVRCGGVYADPFRGSSPFAGDELEFRWRANTGSTMPLDPRFLATVSDRAIVLRMLNNLKQTFLSSGEQRLLAPLARIRSAFTELRPEQAEHRQWMRHWN
jgi:regulator of sirC expression with transglutaminase-like and TPR domain